MDEQEEREDESPCEEASPAACPQVFKTYGQAGQPEWEGSSGSCSLGGSYSSAPPSAVQLVCRCLRSMCKQDSWGGVDYYPKHMHQLSIHWHSSVQVCTVLCKQSLKIGSRIKLIFHLEL